MSHMLLQETEKESGRFIAKIFFAKSVFILVLLLSCIRVISRYTRNHPRLYSKLAAVCYVRIQIPRFRAFYFCPRRRRQLRVTPVLPLYYSRCGTGPSGLCEVTAHTTCSDWVSTWLLGSISGHAWSGRCIDLAVQMPPQITHTHTRHIAAHTRDTFFPSQHCFTGSCAILWLMRLTVCD